MYGQQRRCKDIQRGIDIMTELLPQTPEIVDASAVALIEATIRRREGVLTPAGALAVTTGVFTGRSPRDRYLVVDAADHDRVWWGDINRPIAATQAKALAQRLRTHLNDREHFVLHASVNADADYTYAIECISESPWHTLFAKYLFRDAIDSHHQTNITILHAPSFVADPAVDGTHSGVFIILDMTERMILIGGTAYAGEIKKAVFTMLNFLLPKQGVLPMHAGVNVGTSGDAAVFFGLSGTGKTTLSTDPQRPLIGDDEHGWSAQGIFNFEGGCYAKTIRLSPEGEPDIYAATQHFGTILENVVVDTLSHEPDFDDVSLTENGRAAYPLQMLHHVHASGVCAHPQHIFMLTADAFGVLPPLSRLTVEQAMYHFVSGYTAKVAGTERGVQEPTATFSACFGAPFMVMHPAAYAALLREQLQAHPATVWLVNTGWIGGKYGVGTRMRLAHTRALIRAVLADSLTNAEWDTDPVFGLAMPRQCDGVPAAVLDPRTSWESSAAWQVAAEGLAVQFHQNSMKLGLSASDDIARGAPLFR